MKHLCIDYGAKRVGIAVSDEGGTIAFPREIVANDSSLLGHLKLLVARESIGLIVVGDTLSHGGAHNAVSDAAAAFSDDLTKKTGIPVTRSWEAWSSMEAGRHAPKGHEHDDAAAAAFILQRFLDMQLQPIERANAEKDQ